MTRVLRAAGRVVLVLVLAAAAAFTVAGMLLPALAPGIR